MQNLLEDLTKLLDTSGEFTDENGNLLKNKVIENALKLDSSLLKLLLKNKAIRKHFFTDIDGVLVFDKIKFQNFVSNKQFLPDSYTSFKNKIGLVDEKGDYIASGGDVTLVWPYKDCVLEGGQTKEDQKRDEIFWNETLAPDEIDRLLDPKVLTNWKRYDEKGEHILKDDEKIDFDNVNLIIKGNNLLALHSIYERYAGKVKLIYIDPPYNTRNDSFKYNDRFKRSSWLTFMKSRLEIAKRLLSDDGSIFVQLDYNEVHYFKVLMDEIFGESNFKNEIIWRRKQATSFGSKRFGIVTDTILYYGKSDTTLFNTLFTLDDEHTQNYIKERFIFKDDNGDLYMKSPLVNSLYRPNLKYVFQGINPPKNGWLYSQQKMQEFFDNGELVIPDDPDARIYRKIYLKNYQGQEIQNLWTDIPIVNPMADEQVDFQTQKPEKLLQRIISTSSEKDDLIMDFCFGSGTTAAVAHKMERRYIGIEQMDYLNTITIDRLVNVINGDKAGISENVNWKGGGSFIYCELMRWNEVYMDKIQQAKTSTELSKICKEITKKAFYNYFIDVKAINEKASDFEQLSIKEQKQFLIETLDKNQLYVNHSEIHDEDYKVSDIDKKLNSMFYSRKK